MKTKRTNELDLVSQSHAMNHMQQDARTSYHGHAPRSDEEGLNRFGLTIVERKYPQGMKLNS